MPDENGLDFLGEICSEDKAAQAVTILVPAEYAKDADVLAALENI